MANYRGVINISRNNNNLWDSIEHNKDWVHGQAEEVHRRRSPHINTRMHISRWQEPSLDFVPNSSAEKQVTRKLEDPRRALANA